MDTKKSLGYFPFGPNSQGHSDYSFIPNLNGDEDEDIPDPFEVEVKDEDEFFSKLNNSAHEDQGLVVERDVPKEEEIDSSPKKVVSYYLREDLINRLKSYADSCGESYSGVAADAISSYLKRIGFSVGN